ncbi:MAG TPA: hypothetical protein ENM97_08030 [Moorella mulderi]|nr:hypothetical protein [Moorella mulderi]
MQGLAIPKAAVRWEGGESFVFIIKEGKAWKRPVVLGLEDGERVLVIRGLEEGEGIAVTNVGALREGIAVEEER